MESVRAYVICVDALHYWNGTARVWDTLHVATLFGSREAAVDQFDLVRHVYPVASPVCVPVTVTVHVVMSMTNRNHL